MSKYCVIIEAEDFQSINFQEYVYEDGTYVPDGEPVGVEIFHEDGNVELVLLEGIYFADEPRN